MSSALPALLLVALAMFPYLAVHGFGFVYDDAGYITGNPLVREGLTPGGWRWAWTSFAMANWHPLTWLSHMADVSLLGLEAGRHHLANLVWHALNTLLLYGALSALTGALWRPFIAGAVFAVHPLHVESVAWISERKDLLASTFFLLALLAYRWYVGGRSVGRYVLLTVCFALGLLAKPMIVTLPGVLLLLDFWPLGRARSGLRRPVVEKAPLVLLAAASAVVTVAAQSRGQAIGTLQQYPWPGRLGNAAAGYARYLANTVWPHDLSVFYRHRPPGEIAPSIALGFLLLAGCTVLALGLSRRAPYLASGWLWFAGMLVPVSGLVPLGSQAAADRYMYLPLAGLLIALVWGLTDLVARWRVPRGAMASIATVAVFSLLLVARHQAGHWRDDLALFGHAVAIDPGNGVARNNLGFDLLARRRYAEAAAQLDEAVRQYPGYYDALNNLGIALTNLGRLPEAVSVLRRAVAGNPRETRAYVNLGMAYVSLGDRGAALETCRSLRTIDPGQAAGLQTFVDALPQ